MNPNQTICQRCHNALATVHVKERINGNQTERHLCASCAAKEGFMGSSVWESDPFDTLLGSFFLPNRAAAGRCPTCNRSLNDVKRTGRFGCGDCYGVFEGRVDLSPFTSPEGYKGKRPPSHGDCPPKEEAPRKDEEAERLKQSLKQAVENEEYEKAAKLRDQLRALEGKEGK